MLNDKTGWLFEYQDNDQLADIIRQCESNRDLLISSGQTARKHIETHFSMQATANKYYHLYEH